MRNKGLDILRAIAVILVLFRHSDLENNALKHFGWLGVDLFFVLSGFLISNLLFREYVEFGKIDIRRFAIRRAFKIFIPFYAFLLLNLTARYLYNGSVYEWESIVSELLYVQNYFSGIWLHTWSLAVEEHAYVLLSIAAAILTKKERLRNRLFAIIGLPLLLCLIFMLRLHESYPHRNDDFYGFFGTHLRADGIISGVLLSYLYNFTPWLEAVPRNKFIALSIACLLLAPGFYFEGGSFFMNTIGLTMAHIGFSLVVLLAIDADGYWQKRVIRRLRHFLTIFRLIGVCSYSIYLWHLTSKRMVYLCFSYEPPYMTALYVLLSILLGFLMFAFIERPALKWRDLLFRQSVCA